jgi:hypothetical protein
MSEKLILFETFTTRIEAEVRKGFLESQGIKVFITADDEGGMYPFPLSPTTTGVRLFILEKDLKKAEELYKTIKK